MADTEVLSIRMPTVLKGRVRAEAYKQGVKLSEFIADACRMRLDNNRSSIIDNPEAHGFVAINPKPTMQDLRDICAGKVEGRQFSSHVGYESAGQPAPPPDPVEVPLCHKDWWENGTHYECIMEAGHREQKHGLRGMVQRLDE